MALAVFAGLAGLIGLAVISQLLARQLILDSDRVSDPAGPGHDPGQPGRAVPGPVGGGDRGWGGGRGGGGDRCVSADADQAGPAARRPRGVEVNLAVLAVGLVAIVVLPLVLLVPEAWRAVGRARGPLGVAEPTGPARPSRLGSALGRAGSVPGSVGVRMAFEPGRGRTAVPVRSALAGTIVAVAAVVAAVVFGSSLIALVGTPHQYGQNWDQELDLEFVGAPGALGAKLSSR